MLDNLKFLDSLIEMELVMCLLSRYRLQHQEAYDMFESCWIAKLGRMMIAYNLAT